MKGVSNNNAQNKGKKDFKKPSRLPDNKKDPASEKNTINNKKTKTKN